MILYQPGKRYAMLPFPALSKGVEVPVFSRRELVGLTDSTTQEGGNRHPLLTGGVWSTYEYNP